jgi:hypothetical protein
LAAAKLGACCSAIVSAWLRVSLFGIEIGLLTGFAAVPG